MNTKPKSKMILLFLALMILSTACSVMSADTVPNDNLASINPDRTFGGPDEPVKEIEIEMLVLPPESGMPSSHEVVSDIAESEASEPVSAGESSAAYDGAEAAPPTGVEESRISNQQQYNLRAGSVDDNEQWDDYLLYRMHFDKYIQVQDIDVTERHLIRVINQIGAPVLGAKITIHNEQNQWTTELISHSDGSALFFPLAQDPYGQSYRVVVEKNGQSVSYKLERQTREHEIVLTVDSAPYPRRLDIHFLIDATGSMGDEINQLKDNMVSISEQIYALTGNQSVRFGMTTYRDLYDIFVSRTFDFTPSLELFREELYGVYAEGGGDYPESLNEGLYNALHMPEWRLDETISLIFLIADAPPHLDYGDDFDYAEDVFEATQRGIKIFPIASSGLDDQGEYIFRQLAQITSGKFLFLTYGADGMPGNETTHHVDDYSVLSLDQLVVRLVEEELAALDERYIYTQ